MIDRTAEFERMSNRMLLFSGVAFILKILPVKSITFSDVKLDFSDKSAAIGIVAAFILYLIITTSIIALRDLIREFVEDTREYRLSGINHESEGKPFLETLSEKIERPISYISSILTIIFPLFFSIIVFFICFGDFVNFCSSFYKIVLSSIFCSGGNFSPP